MNIMQIEEWAGRELAIDGWVKLSSVASIRSLDLAQRYGGRRMELRVHRVFSRASALAKELEFMHNVPALYNAERYDAIVKRLMRYLRGMIRQVRQAEAEAMYKAKLNNRFKTAAEFAFEEVYG